MCLRDGHSSKTCDRIDFTDDGNVICVKDEQPLKQYSPIDSIDEGRIIIQNSFFLFLY